MWATGRACPLSQSFLLLMVTRSHVWLFEGAEGGKWVEEIEKKTVRQRVSPPDSEDTADYDGSDDDGEYGDLLPPAVKKARTA